MTLVETCKNLRLLINEYLLLSKTLIALSRFAIHIVTDHCDIFNWFNDQELGDLFIFHITINLMLLYCGGANNTCKFIFRKSQTNRIISFVGVTKRQMLYISGGGCVFVALIICVLIYFLRRRHLNRSKLSSYQFNLKLYFTSLNWNCFSFTWWWHFKWNIWLCLH